MKCVALDIGGANLKAARWDGACKQRAFALHERPDELTGAIGDLIDGADLVLLTMTGELCDCFETKAEGVCGILDAVQAAAESAAVQVWSTRGLFLKVDEARARPLEVAAANWHALSTWLATRYGEKKSLMIDMGSTTTDVILLAEGRVRATGLTDPDRLASGELVYIGARRTPLAALLDRIELDGKYYGVMAERFATTADAFVLAGAKVGVVAEDAARCDTPDGRSLSIPHCAARVLRMIGSDITMHSEAQARDIARQFAQAAMTRVAKGVKQVTGQQNIEQVIVSGEGEAIVRAVIERILPDAEVVSLERVLGASASGAACAYALGQLWQEGGKLAGDESN